MMTDGDQERFEDYLELEAYIEALQSGKVVHPPANLTLEQAHIYQMAALFRSATDENAEPSPEFVEQLKTQLLELSQQQQLTHPASPPTPDRIALPATSSESSFPEKGRLKRALFFSRRGLLTGGATAAASLVVGIGIGYKEPKSENANPTKPVSSPSTYPVGAQQHLYITKNIPTTWHFVTTLADLGDEAVSFASSTIVGYVLRKWQTTEATSNTDDILALVGTCTHMGCLVQWKNAERHFACPCHGALFSDQGTQVSNGYAYTLPPLPSLNTKIEDGKVYVEVPLV